LATPPFVKENLLYTRFDLPCQRENIPGPIGRQLDMPRLLRQQWPPMITAGFHHIIPKEAING